MSFDAFENSVEDGQPIFLYRFALNDKVWCYTSTDTDILTNGETFKAVPIGHGDINQTGESATDAMMITASQNIEPADIFMRYPPSSPMLINILGMHEGDLEAQVVYVGTVTQVNVPTPGTAKITCESLGASMDRAGLRLSWARGCPYALYDPATCKANKAAVAVSHVVSAVTNNHVVRLPTFAGVAVNVFAGGFVEWVSPERGIERRMIESNDAVGNITMFGTADGITVGATLTMYPGCNRTTGDCRDKFNNLLNYGGVPNMQGWSPFDGSTPVFY